MNSSTRNDCLRLMGEHLHAEIPGCVVLRDDGERGLLVKHPSGKVAVIAVLDTHEPARVEDLTSALKLMLRGRADSVDWAVIYCEEGFVANARQVLERRQIGIAILDLDRTGKRHAVRTVYAPKLDAGVGREFVETCTRGIQEAVCGLPSLNDGSDPGFANFSITPREVEAITFFSERELDRRRLELIRKAKKSIVLATYNIHHADLQKLLGERASEGLQVDCILGNQKRIASGNRGAASELGSTKVQLHLAKNHAKCLIVDRRFVIMGSANASESQHQSFEFNLELNSPTLAEKLLELLRQRVEGFTGPTAA